MLQSYRFLIKIPRCCGMKLHENNNKRLCRFVIVTLNTTKLFTFSLSFRVTQFLLIDPFNFALQPKPQ
jgi:hypothetical protein